MSGWTAPTPPGPVVGWELPSEPAGLGVRATIGAGWRVLRANLGTLVATAAIPQIVSNLLTLVSLVVLGRVLEQMFRILIESDWSSYIDDEAAVQRQLEAAYQMPADLAIVSGVASGLTFTVGLIGLAVVTAATQAAVDGQRPSVAGAYRAVAAHAGALIVPAVVLGVGWILIGTPLTLAGAGQGTVAVDEGFRARQALAAVLGLVGFIVTIAVIVLAIRWSLAIPAILAEDLTLRRGLARSAELTAGIRVRIFVILLVLGIVVGIVFGAIALVAGLVVGAATFSILGGILGYMAATTIGGFFWLPLFAAVLSHIYRLRAGPPAAGLGEAVVADAVPSA